MHILRQRMTELGEIGDFPTKKVVEWILYLFYLLFIFRMRQIYIQFDIDIDIYIAQVTWCITLHLIFSKNGTFYLYYKYKLSYHNR